MESLRAFWRYFWGFNANLPPPPDVPDNETWYKIAQVIHDSKNSWRSAGGIARACDIPKTMVEFCLVQFPYWFERASLTVGGRPLYRIHKHAWPHLPDFSTSSSETRP